MRNTLKKNPLKLSGIALIAFLFALSGCGNPAGGGDPPSLSALPAKTVFSVSGTFNGKKFSLASENNYVASRAAVTSGSYPIKGELEDGDIIFRLTGTYDPVARNYIASAASSIIRYSINGAFDASGNDLGSTATVATKEGENWVPKTYVVTKDDTVTISNTKPIVGVDEGTGAHTVATGGIPSWAQGWWSFTQSWGSEKVSVKALLSEWSIMQEVVFTGSEGIDYDSQTCTVIEANSVSTDIWDVVLSYPVYVPTKAQAFAAVAAFINEKKDSVSGRIKTMMESPTPLDVPPFSPPWDSIWWTVSESSITDGQGNVIGTSYNVWGNMPESVQLEYIAVLYPQEGPSPTPFASLEAARTHAQNWLTTKGLSYTYVPWSPSPDGLYYWFENGEVQIGITWDMQPPTQAEQNTVSKLLNEFYATNYLEKYLLANYTITPQSRYSKIRVTFSNSRNNMLALNFTGGNVAGNTYEWDNLNGAKNANTVEPQYNEFHEPNSITLSRIR